MRAVTALIKIPSSPVFDTLGNIINNFKSTGSAELAIVRDKKLSKGKSESHFKIKDNKLVFERVTAKECVRTVICDAENFFGRRPSQKLLIYLLWLINRQAVASGSMSAFDLDFDARELVELGAYKTLTSAKAGAATFLERMKSIYISASVIGDESGGKPKRLIKAFTQSGSHFSVELNPDFNKASLTAYFMCLPECYFKLSHRASVLMYHCCYLARQNTVSVKRYGFFDISLRAVQYRLGLPDEKETKNPKAYVKEPIIKAVEEINSVCPDNEMSLKLIADGDASVGRFLDSGKIRVYTKDIMKDELPDIGFLKKKKRI